MKKLNALFVMLFVAVCTNAQFYPVSSFHLSETDKDYHIFTDISVTSNMELLVEMEASGNDEYAQMQMNKDEMKSLINSLENSKQTFEKWKSIAEANNLNLLSKTTGDRFSDQDIYFTQEGRWYKESGVDLRSVFFIDYNGKCRLIVESDEMNSQELVASSSSFSPTFMNWQLIGFASSKSTTTLQRHSDGAEWAFSSIEEIDSCIKALTEAMEIKQEIKDSNSLLTK